MNKTNIKNIDTDLLRVFLEVYTSKNASHTAKKLGLTQSAVSHSISRLRELFSDPLFVRTQRGLDSTPKAQDLAIKIRAILVDVEDLLSDGHAFNPSTDNRIFRIATTDYFEQTILPDLLFYLSKSAPNVTIISRPTGGELPKEQLENGEIDLAIAGFYSDIPDRFYKQQLFADDFVCVTRKGALKGKTMSLEQFASRKHIVVSPQGDLKTKAQNEAKKHGYELHYAAGVSSFLSPYRILTHSDFVLTCPRRLAESFNEENKLKIFELPFKIPSINVVQVWHQRNSNSDSHRWLRGVIKQLSG